jgi:hypothetical protein
MSNFDLAAGITQDAVTDLISQYFKNPPASPNPFDGDVQKNIPIVGQVTLTWKILSAPTITFGPPGVTVWNAALDSQGQTNETAGNPLPTADVLQLTIPTMQAHYSVNGASKVGGQTSNLVIYATITFSGNDFTVTPVAVTLDESDFSKWNKGVFNGFFLPQLFAAAKSILSTVRIPTLTWSGVTLQTPSFFFFGKLLFGAAILDTNTSPLDVSEVTWPPPPRNGIFALASPNLVNAALVAMAKDAVGTTIPYSSELSDLASYTVQATLDSASATWSAALPTQVNASITFSANVGGNLTAAGMALAVTAGCALCTGQGNLPPGH